MFPKYSNNGIQFPVSQQMEIELGLIGAVALMGAAVQLRILKVLQRKVQEIADETAHFDEEAEVKAAKRMSDVNRERDTWEKEHSGIGKRNESSLSSMPLLNNRESTSIPSEAHSDEGRQRNISGLSDFKAAPTSDEDLRRASRHGQIPGVLPTLDLGQGIQEEVPSNYIAKDVKVTSADLEDLKRKQELLAEIQNIRRSIDILKTETPAPSSSDHSRRPSLMSGRFNTHSQPQDTRARVHSMELLSSLTSTHDVVSRPKSLPLKNDDWDTYIQERKLLQPPSGVTPPIVTSPIPVSRVSVAPAIQEALQRRKQREGVLAGSSESSEDVPLVRFVQQQQQQNANSAQITILPPRRSSTSAVAPVPQHVIRTRTFEELNERHREKMRDIQAPLTQAEKEQAELDAAKRRWERAKAVEREVVSRRQAEKAAALEKRKKAGSPEMGGDRKSRVQQGSRRHGRSLSADMLGGIGTSGSTHSRRLSMMKVEDWQRYQHETNGNGGGGSKSRAMRPEGSVPFPHESLRHLKEKSRDIT